MSSRPFEGVDRSRIPCPDLLCLAVANSTISHELLPDKAQDLLKVLQNIRSGKWTIVEALSIFAKWSHFLWYLRSIISLYKLKITFMDLQRVILIAIHNDNVPAAKCLIDIVDPYRHYYIIPTIPTITSNVNLIQYAFQDVKEKVMHAGMSAAAGSDCASTEVMQWFADRTILYDEDVVLLLHSASLSMNEDMMRWILRTYCPDEELDFISDLVVDHYANGMSHNDDIVHMIATLVNEFDVDGWEEFDVSDGPNEYLTQEVIDWAKS